MSTFQGEVTQASRGRIRDTSNSRKIHFGAGRLHIIKVGADGLLYHDHSIITRDQAIIIVDPCFFWYFL